MSITEIWSAFKDQELERKVLNFDHQAVATSGATTVYRVGGCLDTIMDLSIVAIKEAFH